MIEIDGRSLTLDDVFAVAECRIPARLAERARPALLASRGVIERALTKGDPVYGVNTGFGDLKNRGIAPADLYALHAGMRYVPVPLRADFTLDDDAFVAAIARERPALVWLATPNNPTGRALPLSSIERILAAAPGLVVVDEAYGDFAGASLLPRALEFPNLVVLRTLSKVGLAGARLGYAVAHPAWIVELDKVRSPYNVNALTQAVVPVVLAAGEVLAGQVAKIRSERARLEAALAAIPGFAVTPSDANFVLVRVPDAGAAQMRLRAARILVKNLHGGHPLTANCLRITVGTPAENDALIAALTTP